MNTFKMPEPSIYAHELIENEGGVWLGVSEKGICEQAHTPGETGEEVVAFYKRQALFDVLEQAALKCEEVYESRGDADECATEIRAMMEQIK